MALGKIAFDACVYFYKSNYNFGFIEVGFIINKKRNDILNEINNIIIFSHDKKISNDMCTKYFKGNEEMCKF